MKGDMWHYLKKEKTPNFKCNPQEMGSFTLVCFFNLNKIEFVFEVGCCYVAHARFRHDPPALASPVWDYRHVLLHPAEFWVRILHRLRWIRSA